VATPGPVPVAGEHPADDGQEQCAPDERPLPVPDDLLHGPDGLYHGPDALALDMGRVQDQPVPEGEGESLRDTALRGGSYLVGRELVGMAIRILGVVVVTRLIGPRDFGIYSGAAAFIVVAVTMAQMGMEVYLIRQPEEPTTGTYNSVFTFVLTLSAITVVVALILSAVIEHVHPAAAADVRVFRVLLISVPLNALWAPAQAKIERSLGFRKLALLELGGDALLYGTAVPLAVLGWGPYALVVGIITWQAWLLVGSYRMARMVPRLKRPNAMWSEFLRHGLTYSSSSWVITVSGLANPIVVGRYFGATGVGYVALASRLVDTVGFAQRATWRLGLVALAKVQSDAARVRRGIEEGMVLQVLTVAIPMTVISVLGRFLIPFVFGHRWLPSLSVVALLGTAAVLNGPLTLQMALLYTRAKNRPIVIGAVSSAVVLYVTAVLLVPVVGINGYGVAVIMSTIGWAVVYLKAREIQDFNAFVPVPWMIAFVPAILFPLGVWPENIVQLVPLLIPVLVPSMRTQLVAYAALVLTNVRKISGAR